VPIDLFINTSTNQYYIQLKGLVKASMLPDKDEVLKIDLKVFFFNYSFYPLRQRKGSIQKKKIEKVTKTKKRKRFDFRKYLRLLKTFKIRRLFVNIDTGNCITNAQLFPFIAFLNYKVGHFMINFEGRNQMVLHMQNRPIHIIRSFIKY
jgi:hypothetical protein